MKSQGKQENQQVEFVSDDVEDVLRAQWYLHPFSEAFAGLVRLHIATDGSKADKATATRVARSIRRTLY
jgi:hypothetical protein